LNNRGTQRITGEYNEQEALTKPSKAKDIFFVHVSLANHKTQVWKKKRPP